MRLFSLFFAALISVQGFPALGQIVNQQTLEAANSNPQQQSIEGTIPGIYYDPSGVVAPTFSNSSAGETAGSLVVPPDSQAPSYLNTAWPANATADQVLTIGNLQGNPQFDQFRQKNINEILTQTGRDPATVTLSEVPIATSVTLDQYLQINPGAAEVSVDEAPPVVQAAVGYYDDEPLVLEPIDQTDTVFIEEQAGRPEISDIPAEDLLEGDWGDVFTPEQQSKLEKTLSKVNEKLKKLPIKQIFPLVNGVIAGDWDAVKKQAKQILIQEGSKILVKELLKNPKIAKAIKDLPLGSLQTDKLSLTDAPGLGESALEDIPGADDKPLNQVPGLGDIPLDQIELALTLSFTRFDLLGVIDTTDAAAVVDNVSYTISGGTKDQIPRPTPCKIDGKDTKNCRHFELDNLEGGGKATDLSGKAWVQGSDQKVEGGKGWLRVFANGKEPTGVKPWIAGPVKLILEDIKEGIGGEKGSARLSTAWQFCYSDPITGLHCTPHFIVIPTPYRVKEGGIMLLLARSGSIPDKIAAFRPSNQLGQLACQARNNIVATTGKLPNSSEGDSDHADDGDHADHAHADDDGGNVDFSKKRTPEHFRQQYLKRIALGESSLGTDLGNKQAAIANDGVWGIYQFRYSTAQEVKRRTGFDAYSDDPNEQANAAWAHIGIYGNEVGVDVQGSIEKADFTKADQTLSKNQWTSLPGGAEESSKWGQSTFGTYGPYGDAPDIGSGEIATDSGGDPCVTATGSQPLGKLTRGKGEPGKTYPEYTNAVPGVPINSAYRTSHRPGHNGIDQAAPRGTPVLATNGGKVIRVVSGCTEGDQSCGQGWGNYIVIQHSDGAQSLYAHLQTVNVTEGMDVGRGDGIAGIGNTGHSTGPHLHYEHTVNSNVGVPLTGTLVNPEHHVHR